MRLIYKKKKGKRVPITINANGWTVDSQKVMIELEEKFVRMVWWNRNGKKVCFFFFYQRFYGTRIITFAYKIKICWKCPRCICIYFYCDIRCRRLRETKFISPKTLDDILMYTYALLFFTFSFPLLACVHRLDIYLSNFHENRCRQSQSWWSEDISLPSIVTQKENKISILFKNCFSVGLCLLSKLERELRVILTR